ncbi:hypothetical protein FALCPG4_006014 [Fusarium falciforme]
MHPPGQGTGRVKDFAFNATRQDAREDSLTLTLTQLHYEVAFPMVHGTMDRRTLSWSAAEANLDSARRTIPDSIPVPNSETQDMQEKRKDSIHTQLMPCRACQDRPLGLRSAVDMDISREQGDGAWRKELTRN